MHKALSVSYLYRRFFALTLILCSAASASFADESQALGGLWEIARGGQLYDEWYRVLGTSPPRYTHPAYPSEGRQEGSTTWRCKECHGWDYRGHEGAYGQGFHATGIKGIRDKARSDPRQILNIIMDETHQYTFEMIPLEEMKKLATFVSLGQIDTKLYIDHETRRSYGDAKRGESPYQTLCAVCHDVDGKRALTTREEGMDGPEYMGTLAQNNPWEFLHKVRFGQPGIPMISLITLPAEDIVDILTYSQTLPAE
ncbi:MAG: cytochrome c [Gammaproteobacteria bacterium]|nr:cytochrome c [Gammaproteobacteria bacterium]